MRIHALPGIHTGPISCLENLLPYLMTAGFEVVFVDYSYIYGVETKVVNPIIMHTLLPYIEPGDVIVGHSNGGALAYDLMNAGAKVAGLVLINAALTPRITRAVGVKFIDCYWNPGDSVVEMAEVAEHLGIVDPSWGDMGRVGYYGDDPAIASINCAITPILPLISGHSDVLTFAHQTLWGPWIGARIKAHLSTIGV